MEQQDTSSYCWNLGINLYISDSFSMPAAGMGAYGSRSLCMSRWWDLAVCGSCVEYGNRCLAGIGSITGDLGVEDAE